MTVLVESVDDDYFVSSIYFAVISSAQNFKIYKIELKHSSASILSVGCVRLAKEAMRAFTFEPGKKILHRMCDVRTSHNIVSFFLFYTVLYSN